MGRAFLASLPSELVFSGRFSQATTLAEQVGMDASDIVRRKISDETT